MNGQMRSLLWATYGKPERITTGDEASNVFTFRYRDKEAYDAFVASNAANNPEVTQLGFTEEADGTIIGKIHVDVR